MRNTNLSQVMSPEGSSSTGPCSTYPRMILKPIIDTYSAYDSAESIATPPDSDLEDEQLRKMLASPLYTEVSVKPDAENAHKCEADAQLAQSHHSRRESLMSSSSQDLEAPVKLDASCHSESSQNTFPKRDRSNESGHRFESSVHSFLELRTQRKLENVFLMETRIICLIK